MGEKGKWNEGANCKCQLNPDIRLLYVGRRTNEIPCTAYDAENCRYWPCKQSPSTQSSTPRPCRKTWMSSACSRQSPLSSRRTDRGVRIVDFHRLNRGWCSR